MMYHWVMTVVAWLIAATMAYLLTLHVGFDRREYGAYALVLLFDWLVAVRALKGDMNTMALWGSVAFLVAVTAIIILWLTPQMRCLVGRITRHRLDMWIGAWIEIAVAIVTIVTLGAVRPGWDFAHVASSHKRMVQHRLQYGDNCEGAGNSDTL